MVWLAQSDARCLPDALRAEVEPVVDAGTAPGPDDVGPGPGDTWLDRANMTRIHNLLDRGAKVNFEGMCRVGEADSRGKERRRGCSALPVLERDRGRKTAVCSAAGWGRD